MYEYKDHFYRFLASFAVRSAEQIVPLLSALLPINSVVDFGCGQGAWLSVWRKAGASVMGVDGPYLDQQHLMIDADDFRTADLSQPVVLERRFDLVQSLEVAEHLPSSRASDFIGTLTAHGPLVMFSAAVPGQGGEHHINEQPLEYWREKFRERDFIAIDCVRPEVIENPRIQHWYRYNIVLYAEKRHLEKMPDRVRAFRVPENQSLCDFWPLPDRIRHAFIRQLPSGAVDYLSRCKARLEARKAKSAGSLLGKPRAATGQLVHGSSGADQINLTL
jgi:SAM-dependent methyltransferase